MLAEALRRKQQDELKAKRNMVRSIHSRMPLTVKNAPETVFSQETQNLVVGIGSLMWLGRIPVERSVRRRSLFCPQGAPLFFLVR